MFLLANCNFISPYVTNISNKGALTGKVWLISDFVPVSQQIWAPGDLDPGQNPLMAMDPPWQIWTP